MSHTAADVIAASPNPYERSIALMSYRDKQPTYVVFHFADESSLRFEITYTLSGSPQAYSDMSALQRLAMCRGVL